jgi:hypothetical protein
MYNTIPPICGSSLERLGFKRYHGQPDNKNTSVFFFLPNKHTHKHLPDIIKMPSPLRQVAWECGECATTNRGTEQLPCSYCRAENPRRYEILAGSAPAATARARTVQVMRTEQHDIVRAASEARVAVVPRPVVGDGTVTAAMRTTTATAAAAASAAVTAAAVTAAV